MRRDEDRDIHLLRGPEKVRQVLDRAVLGHTIADAAPGDARGAEEVILRIGHDRGGGLQLDREFGVGESRVIFPAGGGRFPSPLRGLWLVRERDQSDAGRKRD